MNEEKILCIPRALYEKAGVFEGISFDLDRYLPLFKNAAEFRPKDEVEEQLEWKQLVCYTIVVDGNTLGGTTDTVPRLLAYTRMKGLGDNRIAGKKSVGFGGHLNEDDCQLPSNATLWKPPYQIGSAREMREELKMIPMEMPTIYGLLGFITGETVPIDKHHLGLLHMIATEPGTDVESNTDEHVLDRFYSFKELAGMADEFESWSKMIIAAGPDLVRMPLKHMENPWAT